MSVISKLLDTILVAIKMIIKPIIPPNNERKIASNKNWNRIK